MKILLGIFIGLTWMTLPCNGAQEDWQNRVLSFPYRPARKLDRPALLLIRQDYEELQVNRNILNGPLKIGSKVFDHCIGTHAVSRIRVTSPKPIERFRAWIGVDNNKVTNPSGNPIGSVVFSLESGNRECFQSGLLRAGQEPIGINVHTGGARIIDLCVGDGGNGPTCDWADWAEAAIVLEGGDTVHLHEMKIETGGKGARYPISFMYGGKLSDHVLDSWQADQKSEALDGERTRETFTWIDPETGLRVAMEAVRFSDFPAVEWLLYFENTGSKDTPIIENVQALDMTLDPPAVEDAQARHGVQSGLHAAGPGGLHGRLGGVEPDIDAGGDHSSQFHVIIFQVNDFDVVFQGVPRLEDTFD